MFPAALYRFGSWIDNTHPHLNLQCISVVKHIEFLNTIDIEQGPTLTVAQTPGATKKKKTMDKQNLPKHARMGKYRLGAQYQLCTALLIKKPIKMDHFSVAMTATESRTWRAMLNPFHTWFALRQKI